jgi:hypothetical protein
MYGDVFVHSTTATDNYPVGALAVAGGINVAGTIKANYVISNNYDEIASDRKFKKDIDYDVVGLDFINKLKPCQYTLIGNTFRNFGLIAQEIQETLDEFKIKNSHIVVENNDGLHVGYMNLLSIMIKAIQEIDNKLNKIIEIVK